MAGAGWGGGSPTQLGHVVNLPLVSAWKPARSHPVGPRLTNGRRAGRGQEVRFSFATILGCSGVGGHRVRVALLVMLSPSMSSEAHPPSASQEH